MKYMLLMYMDQKQVPTNQTPEEFQALGKEWYALGEEMKAKGVYLGNNGLEDVSDATTVRVRDGKILTTDGPFAETHETLGGYYLLNCKDLDEAIQWAAKIPVARGGSIEIRPLNKWSQQG